MELIIAPSILACDLSRLGESVSEAESCGADWHHFDVMDGHFVPNLTFGPDMVKAVKASSSLPVDVHLMIDNPADLAEAFIKAGADLITFHIEVVDDPLPLLDRIHELGARAGLVAKPATPISSLFPYLPEIDLTLVMTVEPGFTGQKFMPDCVSKVAELRAEGGPDLHIQVDGGINAETAALTARAGANVSVAGAAVYRTPDMKASIEAIRQSMTENFAQPG